MHILETTTIGSETLVERDGVTLVVLPVRDTRRDHPVLLLLSRRLPRRRPQDGRRRRGRTPGDLLRLETRRLERVLNNFGHLDDALGGPGLGEAGRVADVGGAALGVRDLGGGVLVKPNRTKRRQEKETEQEGSRVRSRRTLDGWAALILPLVSFSRAALVRSAVLMTSSSEGRCIERSALVTSVLWVSGMRSAEQPKGGESQY